MSDESPELEKLYKRWRKLATKSREEHIKAAIAGEKAIAAANAYEAAGGKKIGRIRIKSREELYAQMESKASSQDQPQSAQSDERD